MVITPNDGSGPKILPNHCPHPQTNESCTSEGCLPTCRTTGYCYKMVAKNDDHVKKVYRFVIKLGIFSEKSIETHFFMVYYIFFVISVNWGYIIYRYFILLF